MIKVAKAAATIMSNTWMQINFLKKENKPSLRHLLQIILLHLGIKNSIVIGSPLTISMTKTKKRRIFIMMTNIIPDAPSILILKLSNPEKLLQLQTIFNKSLKQKYVATGKWVNVNLALNVPLLMVNTSCYSSLIFITIIEQKNVKISIQHYSAITETDVNFIMTKNLSISNPKKGKAILAKWNK